MPQFLTQIQIHLIFSTNHRAPLIKDKIRDRLHHYIGVVLKNHNCPVTLVNSTEDHVHILFELDRAVTIKSAVQEVKNKTAVWMKTQGPEFSAFAWQVSYGAFAVSKSAIPAALSHISNQPNYHKKSSFQDEFRAALKEQGLEYDERYVWD